MKLTQIIQKILSYNPQVLAQRIKMYRDQSNELKNLLRQKGLPEMQRMIAALQVKIQKGSRQVGDIAGCWVLMVGTDDFPTLNITKNDFGEYKGVITYKGKLANIRTGHKLFSVARINQTTYEGTEYSYSRDGNTITKIHLRLILSKDQLSVSYRSDQVYAMRRCN